MDSDSLGTLIDRFLAADQRARKQLLKEITPRVDRAAVERLAPAIRDPSPRICARVTSLMARFELDELFESLLDGLKPGKIAILRGQYRKIRAREEDSEGGAGQGDGL